MLSLKSTSRHPLLCSATSDQLCSTNGYSDICIQGNGGGSPVSAHRLLLAAASPLLSTVLQDLPHYPSVCIVLPDTSVVIIRHLLSVFYSGKLECSSREEYTRLIDLMNVLEVEYCDENGPENGHQGDIECDVVECEQLPRVDECHGAFELDESETFTGVSCDVYNNNIDDDDRKPNLCNGGVKMQTGEWPCETDEVEVNAAKRMRTYRGVWLGERKTHTGEWLDRLKTHTGEWPLEAEEMGVNSVKRGKTHKVEWLDRLKTHTGEWPYEAEEVEVNAAIEYENGDCDVIYSCSDCGKCFSSATHLQKHAAKMHKEGMFKCDQCDHSTNQKNGLIRHVQVVHDKVREFECEICRKQFSQKANLTKHYDSVHLKLKRYKCSICSAQFAQNAHLITHYRTHTGEKPFSCRTCAKSFKDYSSLSGHEASHRHQSLPSYRMDS